MSSKNIYIPTPCQILEQMFWDYDPPTEKDLVEGSTATGIYNGDHFKGVPKWYKVTTPILHGKDNPRARKVYAEGKEYDTIRECCEAYGFKNHNAIRYRLNHNKWTEWYYV